MPLVPSNDIHFLISMGWNLTFHINLAKAKQASCHQLGRGAHFRSLLLNDVPMRVGSE